MSEDIIIEGEATEVSGEEATEEKQAVEPKATAAALKDALERVESLGKTLAGALQDRANVVMVRVNDEALQHMDMLVEADITKSRSESAAFLITEGVKALKAMPGPTIAIVGGQKKDVELQALAETIAQRCRLVICIGESADNFASAIQSVTSQSKLPLIRNVQGVQQAIDLAHAEATPGDHVLFSPGAPSYDQYANFVERGNAFVGAVQLL